MNQLFLKEQKDKYFGIAFNTNNRFPMFFACVTKAYFIDKCLYLSYNTNPDCNKCIKGKDILKEVSNETIEDVFIINGDNVGTMSNNLLGICELSFNSTNTEASKFMIKNQKDFVFITT